MLVQGRDYDKDVVAVAEASENIETEEMLTNLRKEIAEREEQAKIAADPTANLPPGWNVAYVRLALAPVHVPSITFRPCAKPQACTSRFVTMYSCSAPSIVNSVILRQFVNIAGSQRQALLLAQGDTKDTVG
jgi:hypothetical protein